MADIEGFDLDRTTGAAWESFTARLAEVLSVMDSSEDLTISVAAGGATTDVPPAIRFSATGSGEVTATLLGSGHAQLESLGWRRGPDGNFRLTGNQEQPAALARAVTATLSDALGVLHPVFLEADQLAELLRGEPVPDALLTERGTVGVVMPTSRAQLDEAIDAELARLYGRAPLRDEDGDLALRVGSTIVFLRTTADFREVLLFSAIVHDVAGRSRACEVLNDLNAEARYCRFALHRDRVFVQISVFAQPFVPAHLVQALEALAAVADGIDDELADRLGGRTTFPG